MKKKLTKKRLKELTQEFKSNTDVNSVLDYYSNIISDNDKLHLYYKREKVKEIRQSKLLDNYLFIKTDYDNHFINPKTELLFFKILDK